MMALRLPPRQRGRNGPRRTVAALLPVLLGLTLVSPQAAAAQAGADQVEGPTARGGPPQTYANPVAEGVADDFPDPSIIRGRDGYWYAYATGSRAVPDSDTRGYLPMIRSKDLVSWEYLGTVFDESNWPSWFDDRSRLWGPSIEFVDGRYVLYFVGVNVPGYDKPNKSLGVATAPTPAGPWTDSGAPLIAPQYYQRPPHTVVRHRSLIAPDGIQAADGRRYLYYGGFNGGVWGVPMSDDGVTVAGDAVQLVDSAHFEGPYVVRRGGWYYMFVSSNHCCLGGPVAGYTGWVVRSRDPLGPFVDRQGLPARGTYPGGTVVSFANGNRWVSPGVNSLTTDLAGQDWMVYHAVDREQPYQDGPFQGGLKRGLFIDRLDWIDGWPTVREGRGPSEGQTAAPVAAASVLADSFESGQLSTDNWSDPAGWRVATEPAGGYARTDAADGERVLWARRPWSEASVVRAAVRTPLAGRPGAVGVRLADWGGALVAEATVNGRSLEVTIKDAGEPAATTSRALPAGFDPTGWHELTADLGQGELRVRLANVGADHPVADLRVPLPAGLVAGKVGLLARGTTADVDDVTVTAAAVPHDELVPDPRVGQVDPAMSEEFTDGPGAGWSWVREPSAQVNDGVLEFPVQPGTIMGDRQDASLLTRPVPLDEEWTVETKLDLDMGETPLWGFPMAGMVAYAGDDDWVVNVVHGRNIVHDARMIRETVYAGRVVNSEGGAMTGAAGQPTTWLRLHHSIDPDNGEHHLRGAASIDGENWTWVTTYTMPAGTDFKIGLIAAGASPDDPAFTARFDYLRILRP